MEDFKKFSEKYPDAAKIIAEMSKEELLDHFAREVVEKDKLAEYKDDTEFFKKDLEWIVNLGITWMSENNKNNHHIYIKKGKSKLIYSKTKERFI